MKAKSSSFIRGLLLAILMCVFAFALVACGDDDKTPEGPGDTGTTESPAPTVTNVTITAADGAEYGKVGEEHILSYTATEGSTITVTVKKGTSNAVSNSDYLYDEDSKVIEFIEAGEYTVTVTAKKNNKTGSGSASITITDESEGPEITSLTVTHKSGDEGYVGSVYTIAYTVDPEETEVEITVMKGENEAEEDTDYTLSGNDITFLTAGTYTVVATPEEGEEEESAPITISLPTVSNLTVSTDEYAGYAYMPYTVSYDVAPTGTNVTVVIMKGENEAVENTDYLLDEGKLYFLTAGTYKVVATPAGGSAVESDSIVIVLPTITVSVKDTAEVSEDIELTITTTPAGVNVYAYLYDENGETEIDKEKYEFDFDEHTLRIKEVGTYKVEVAIAGTNITAMAENTITVSPSSNPVFELSVDHEAIEENETATITVGTVTYPEQGDTMESSSWKIEYRAPGSAYAEADAADYEWTEATQTFKGLKVGSYRITHFITCSGGHTGKDSIVITVTPATLTLTATTTGWQNASAIDLNYTVEGYVNNYTVSYATTNVLAGQGDVTKNSATEKEASSKVNVTAGAIVAEYTVTYTHILDSETTYSVTFYVYGGETDGPAFGTNVTHNVLLPDVALKLYADEAQGATVEYTLLDTDKAEISDLANVGKVIKLKDGATGTITLAVIATKDGKSTATLQTFTVGTRGGNNAMSNYYTAVTGDSHTGINYNWLDNDNNVHKNETLLTKEGFVFNRDNKDTLDGGDMIEIPLSENNGKTNLQLEFDFTILDKHGPSNNNKSNNVSLAIYFVPAANWGGSNQIAMYSDKEGGMEPYTGTDKVMGTNPTFPQAGEHQGFKIHVRITRMIANGKVLYLTEWKLEDDAAYTTWHTITVNEENGGTNMGSPLNRIQFTHECGSYAIENLTFNGAFTLPSINATLDKATMRTNETATLEYSLDNAVNGGVTMKVYKNDAEVASDKYTYEGTTLAFTEAGTYKIVLTAFGATTVEKTITVNEVPTVKVNLPAVIKVNTAASLTVTVKYSTETPDVKVQKQNGDNWEEAATTDYTYENDEITFTVTGTYKVIASIEEGAISNEVITRVTNASAPTFTVTASEASVTEGASVTMTAGTVTYDTAEGDAEGNGVVTYTVLYCATGSDYAEIDNASDYYTVEGDTITLKMAGNYRIVGSVTSQQGITGTATADVTATPAAVTLTFNGTLTNGWYRMAANDTDTDIAYDVVGGTNYNVTYENGSASQNAPVAGKGLVSVHWAEPNTYLVKVIYTHKTITSTKYELVIKVSAVSDLATSPILGEDPFDGTYTDLAPAFAMALYNKTYAANGTDAFAGVISYEIVNNQVKNSADNTTSVVVKTVGTLPYVLVEDWAKPKTSSGTFVLKMMLKENADGNVLAAASQTFTVTPFQGTNGVADEYFQRVMTAYGNTDNALELTTLNPETNLCEHACITRNGILFNRENVGWGGDGDFGRIYVAEKGVTASVNSQWQIDYKITLYGFSGDDFCLKHYFHMGDGSNGAGNLDVKKASGGNIDAWGWMTATGNENPDNGTVTAGQSGAEEGCYQPTASDLPTLYVRFTRIVDSANNRVTITCYFSEDGVTYKRAYERYSEILNPATDAGNVGNPVNYLRLEKTAAASYSIENVKVTSLDA